MLYSQGVPLETSAFRAATAGRSRRDARKIWRTFAAHYHLFRGTPTRMWLDHAFATVFGIDERLTAESADRYFDRINDCLARPEFRPRALFERFNIEVIATTESPLDPLVASPARFARAAGAGASSPPTAPIRSPIPSSTASPANVAQLGALTGENTATWSGYLAAHRNRRAFFKSMGATSTDHGHPTAQTCDLDAAHCAARCSTARCRARSRRRKRRRSAARCSPRWRA